MSKLPHTHFVPGKAQHYLEYLDGVCKKAPYGDLGMRGEYVTEHGIDDCDHERIARVTECSANTKELLLHGARALPWLIEEVRRLLGEAPPCPKGHGPTRMVYLCDGCDASAWRLPDVLEERTKLVARLRMMADGLEADTLGSLKEPEVTMSKF